MNDRFVTLSVKEYEELVDAKDSAEARATEYYNLLCRMWGTAQVLAGNFDEAMQKVTPDPRTK